MHTNSAPFQKLVCFFPLFFFGQSFHDNLVSNFILSYWLKKKCFFFRFPLFFCATDQNELLAARTFLETAAQQNIAEFLKALSEVLANVSCSAVARTAAGLQLKNHLTSKDLTITENYHKRWLSFDENTREYIKNNVSTWFFLWHFGWNSAEMN